MVNSISSLQPKALTFVFCQFILSLRDAASIVSGVGTRSSSSSARRDTDSEIQISEELWPNATTIRQDSTVLMNRKVKSFLNKQCFYRSNVWCQKLQVFKIQPFGLDTGPQSSCHTFTALSVICCLNSAQKFAVQVCQVAAVKSYHQIHTCRP